MRHHLEHEPLVLARRLPRRGGRRERERGEEQRGEVAVRREVVMARRHKLVFVAAVVLVVSRGAHGGRARTRTEAKD